MRQVFVPKAWIDTQKKQAILVDDPFHHLVHVLRKQKGQWVEAFDGEGGLYHAQLLEVLPDKAILAMGDRKEVAQTESFRLTLGLGILKGKKMSWVIQKVTELGVETIVPLLTDRTISRPAEGLSPKSGGGKIEKWEKIAIEAAKQCGRTFVPNIHHPIRLADFSPQTADFDAKLLAWEAQAGESSATRLRAWAADFAKKLKQPGRPASVLLLVGPEGGFSASEAEALQRDGFVPMGLGKNILRSETAALIACALVSYELATTL